MTYSAPALVLIGAAQNLVLTQFDIEVGGPDRLGGGLSDQVELW